MLVKRRNNIVLLCFFLIGQGYVSAVVGVVTLCNPWRQCFKLSEYIVKTVFIPTTKLRFYNGDPLSQVGKLAHIAGKRDGRHPLQQPCGDVGYHSANVLFQHGGKQGLFLLRSALFKIGDKRSEEHTSELQSRENLVC